MNLAYSIPRDIPDTTGRQEAPLWQDRPSQLIGLPIYLGCSILLLAAAISGHYLPAIPWQWRMGIWTASLLVAAVAYIRIQSHRYSLTTQRLSSSRGILIRRTDDLELYRVKDSVVIQPIWDRLIGKGDVVLTTTDSSSPLLTLRAIHQPHAVREMIRANVEQSRLAKGVREIDMV